MNLALFVLSVLCWGSTWVAITFQTQSAEIETGIAWRFLTAAFMLFVWLKLTRRWQSLHWSQIKLCLIQSIFIAGLNYVCFYNAISFISSGMAALIFAMAPLINSINNYLFFRQTSTMAQNMGALIGIGGLALVLMEGGGQFTLNDILMGVLLGTMGTYSFSIGNMLSTRMQDQGVNPATSNVWSMGAGGVMLTIWSALSGAAVIPPMDSTFWLSTGYLALVGSVLGFTFYFMLLGRVGSVKAGYVALASPVVAVLLSSAWEGWDVSVTAWFGISLVLFGNWVGLVKKRS